MRYEKTAIHRVDIKKESIKQFSQRGFAQFGTVKYSNTRIGHEKRNFTRFIVPPAGTRKQHITETLVQLAHVQLTGELIRFYTCPVDCAEWLAKKKTRAMSILNVTGTS